MLLRYEIKPYVVFDGDKLPTKSSVENGREKSRHEAKLNGMALLREGKYKQAQDQFQKSVDVTPTMAAMVIEVLKRRGIPYVVAPYEADAQLVYLEQRGFIQAIISEDSDLLVFGAQCMITKMDNVGRCIEIRRDMFHKSKDMSLGDFTDDNLRTMAILSGCDYSPGIPGIGPVKAYNLVRRYRQYEKVCFEGDEVEASVDRVKEN